MTDVFRILERYRIAGKGPVYVIKNYANSNIRIGDVFYDLRSNRFKVKGIEMFRRTLDGMNIEDTTIGIMFELIDAEFEYGGWHLHFDADRKWVQITDNGTDKYLSMKFIPAEMSYRTLVSMINKEETGDLEIRYLE